MNDTEIDLCRELAGLLGPGKYPRPFITIEDLLEILREKGRMVWSMWEGRDVKIGGGYTKKHWWGVAIYFPNSPTEILNFKGDTLTEALLRAVIAVIKEAQ